MGEECLSVNSCGGLFYFNKEHAPEGATAYCSDCPHLGCIYKAQTIYTSETGRGFSVYFTTREKTDENILADLAKTQYDRCVFGCDNEICEWKDGLPYHVCVQ